MDNDRMKRGVAAASDLAHSPIEHLGNLLKSQWLEVPKEALPADFLKLLDALEAAESGMDHQHEPKP